MVALILKVGRIFCGSLLVIAGLIVWPLPIPFGAIMCFAGFGILSVDSPFIRKYFEQIKNKLFKKKEE